MKEPESDPVLIPHPMYYTLLQNMHQCPWAPIKMPIPGCRPRDSEPGVAEAWESEFLIMAQVILMWAFPEPHTFWETVPRYWHNWPLPFFKHFLWLLWYNIFFWFCGLSESVVLHLLLPLLAGSVAPDSAPCLLLPLLSVPMRPSTCSTPNSGRWSPIQPFWCQHPGESHGAAW